MLFALKECAVEQIISTWGLAEVLAFMKKHWEIICNNIEQGKITFALDVSAELVR